MTKDLNVEEDIFIWQPLIDEPKFHFWNNREDTMNNELKVTTRLLTREHVNRLNKSFKLIRPVNIDEKMLLIENDYRGYWIRIYADEIGQYDAHILYKGVGVHWQCMMEHFDETYIYAMAFIDGYIKAQQDFCIDCEAWDEKTSKHLQIAKQ